MSEALRVPPLPLSWIDTLARVNEDAGPLSEEQQRGLTRLAAAHARRNAV